MTQVRLILLGGFSARGSDGGTIALPTRKAEALLSVLACRSGEGQRRDWLTGLLWGGCREQKARHSLSQALTSIRGSLNDAASALVAERETVALCPEVADVDVVAFQRLAHGDGMEDMQAAAALYRGPLLDGFTLRDGAFEEWLSRERAQLHDLAISVLMTLAQVHAARGDADAGESALSRLLALDPSVEEAHRLLIRLDLDRGCYNAAIRHYRQCADALARELDTVPEPATTVLYRDALFALRHGHDRAPQTAQSDAIERDAEWIGAAPATVPTDHDPSAFSDPAPDAGRRVSIAVLPYVTIGGDPEQEIVADGVTEDLITDLSRFRMLQVTSRNASSRHRRQDADLKRVGRELGVDYLVLGSVRRHGVRMRLTAQLVDARSESQVWAERFDRDEEDVVLADDLVRTIAATLAGRVHAAGSELAKRKPATSLAAYECVLRANAAQMQVGDPQAESEMRQFYERAAGLDPGYGRAYAGLALARLRAWFRDPGGSGAALESAVELAAKAVALDPNDGECQETLGWILLHGKSFELAEQYYRRALELNPISPDELASMGALCSFQGRPEDGIGWFEQAKQVDPFFDPTWYWQLLGATYFNARRYGESITAFNRSPAKPGWVHAYLAACHACRGDGEEATAAAALARRCPGFSAVQLAGKEPYKLAADREHLLDGLRRAGL
jgi:TolB-like protein/DNA-binding SARP family transcriptional activator